MIASWERPLTASSAAGQCGISRMNRNQGFGILLMLLLVVLGISMLVSPQALIHTRPPQTEAIRSLFEVLKMVWCTQGGVAMIVLGAIVGALSARSED